MGLPLTAKSTQSCGSNVTDSRADVQMGNLQTNCPHTRRCADRLSQHCLCLRFVCLARGGWNAFWADNGLAQVCNYFGGKLPAHPGWWRFVLPASSCRVPPGKHWGHVWDKTVLLPYCLCRRLRRTQRISAAYGPRGTSSHLTNIICSITKQQYFGT